LSDARQRFLEAAVRIGRRLCRDAVWHDGRCNWLGWAMEPHGGQWVSAYRAMGVSAYDGAAGIGLFLARLAPLADDPIIAATAFGALAQALTTVDETVAAGDYGFYAGLSGVAQCCVEAGTALQRDDLIARGRAAWLSCAELPPLPQRLDVINGSAGLVPALIEAAQRFKRDDFVEAAVRHGEHLVRYAQRASSAWFRAWRLRDRLRPGNPLRNDRTP
jgi:lantibiotic modifying enzyme